MMSSCACTVRIKYIYVYIYICAISFSYQRQLLGMKLKSLKTNIDAKVGISLFGRAEDIHRSVVVVVVVVVVVAAFAVFVEESLGIPRSGGLISGYIDMFLPVDRTPCS